MLSEANSRAAAAAAREIDARRAVDIAEGKMIDAEAAQRRSEADARHERERAERAEKERDAALNDARESRAEAAMAGATQRRAEQRIAELEQSVEEQRATLQRRITLAEQRADEADERLRVARGDAAAAVGAAERELAAERRLAELHSTRADTAEQRLAELQVNYQSIDRLFICLFVCLLNFCNLLQRGFDAILGELERTKVNAASRQQQIIAERDVAEQRATNAETQYKTLKREFDALEVGSDGNTTNADDNDIIDSNSNSNGDSLQKKERLASAERAKRLSAIESLPSGDERRTQLLLELES